MEAECKGIDFRPGAERKNKSHSKDKGIPPKMKLANALAASSDNENDE
jgi:hypothetical protein